MSCRCQRCNQLFKVDIIVPDEIWEQIKPAGKSKDGGLLCGFCIVAALEKKGYAAWVLTPT